MRISDGSSDVCSSDLLKVIDADGTAFLAIADDGAGIEDPSVILALGRSGWGDEIARRADPAGMGVFSLAGRDVEIRSCPRSTGEGWSIRIASGDWESGPPLADRKSVLPGKGV